MTTRGQRDVENKGGIYSYWGVYLWEEFSFFSLLLPGWDADIMAETAAVKLTHSVETIF